MECVRNTRDYASISSDLHRCDCLASNVLGANVAQSQHSLPMRVIYHDIVTTNPCGLVNRQNALGPDK
jgi:hypothetical protein